MRKLRFMVIGFIAMSMVGCAGTSTYTTDGEVTNSLGNMVIVETAEDSYAVECGFGEFSVGDKVVVLMDSKLTTETVDDEVVSISKR